jgi:hypothetical protein
MAWESHQCHLILGPEMTHNKNLKKSTTSCYSNFLLNVKQPAWNLYSAFGLTATVMNHWSEVCEIWYGDGIYIFWLWLLNLT